MADVFTPEKRSEVMSRIRGRDTKPELALRSMLHRLGYLPDAAIQSQFEAFEDCHISLPDDGQAPRNEYLAWHRENLFLA